MPGGGGGAQNTGIPLINVPSIPRRRASINEIIVPRQFRRNDILRVRQEAASVQPFFAENSMPIGGVFDSFTGLFDGVRTAFDAAVQSFDPELGFSTNPPDSGVAVSDNSTLILLALAGVGAWLVFKG